MKRKAIKCADCGFKKGTSSMMWEPSAKSDDPIMIIGGGLPKRGCLPACKKGVRVKLYEMRPKKYPPAHRTSKLAELVCSNSLGSDMLSSLLAS